MGIRTMKMHRISNVRMLVATIFMGAVLSVPVQPASAKDMLPLRRGIFVNTQVTCSNASNAYILSYWGDKLNSSRVVGHIKRVAKKKGGFVVTLALEGDGGMGSNQRSTENWTISARSKTEFQVITPRGTNRFRWCSSKM